jgi:4,5-dihydroxyphthalate decarboxylase
MTRLTLSIAIGDYDQVRDVTSGRVAVEGVDLHVLNLPVEEVFARFSGYREWDISEFSFGKYVSLVASGDDSLVAIPVFPSRVFRHSSIYVRGDARFESIEELAGARIGVPEWAQTASIYSRGMLHHLYGVPLSGVRWTQAGVNSAGRREKVRVNPPDGVVVEHVSNRSLNEMLLSGDLDAILSARPPDAFMAGGGEIRRLIADYPRAERLYYEETGVFPIMHVVVIRAQVFDRHPWVARNLFDALDRAKDASVARMSDATASWIPLPWTPARVAASEEMFGSDPWPYGVEPNRVTIETFLTYAYEQGVCERLLTPEELFVPATQMVLHV